MVYVSLAIVVLAATPVFGTTLNENAVVCELYEDAARLAEMLAAERSPHEVRFYTKRHCHRAPLSFEIIVLEAHDRVSKIRLDIDGSEWWVVNGSY